MSKTAFPSLAQSVKVGELQLKNRIVMASMTRSRAVPTNVANDVMGTYYEQRASTGLILSEGTLVYQQGTEWNHVPGIWNEDQVAGWKAVTDRVHAAGGQMVAQLWSVGRVAHPDMPEQKAAGEPVWAPSAISARGGKFRALPGQPGYVTPTAIDDPNVLIQRFVEGAKNAKKAGFDGIELHAANGYLVHQFLDSTSNKRTDQWGGSLENRIRFAVTILRELTKVYPPGRIGIKLNPFGGYNDVGMPLDDTVETFSALIKECVALKLGYIQLVRYLEFFDPEFDGVRRGTKMDVWGTFVPLIKGSETKVLLNGDIQPEEAEKLVKEGQADAIVIGRPLIGNPDYVERIQSGKELNGNLNYAGM